MYYTACTTIQNRQQTQYRIDDDDVDGRMAPAALAMLSPSIRLVSNTFVPNFVPLDLVEIASIVS